MTSSSPSNEEEQEKEKTWIGLIDESVHTFDDIDIGDIDAVSRDFVVVKRGFVNVHYYYIPISKVEGWDSHVLWLKITEEEVIRNYERDLIPDPTRYHVKDYPAYSTDCYPELTMIPSRYTRPIYILVLVLILQLKLHQYLTYLSFINATFVVAQALKQKTN
jgi:hypothetical protein